MHFNEFTKQVFPTFFKPTPAILPAMHEVKQWAGPSGIARAQWG